MSGNEIVAVRQATERGDASAVMVTASGSVWMSPGFLNTLPPDRAWLGLQDLHYRASGEESPDLVGMAQGMTPEQALDQYYSGIASVLGQLGSTGQQAGENILNSLNEYAGLTGNFDGLDGPFMAAVSSAARDPSSAALDRGAALLQELGFPNKLGGGTEMSPTFDVQAGKVVWNDAQTLASAFSGHLDAEKLFGAIQGLADHTGVGSAVGVPSEATLAWHAISEVGSAVVTGVVIGGPLGAVTGFLMGLAAVFGLIAEGSPAAKDAAEGKSVAVERTEIVTKTEHKSITIGPDGTRTETHDTTTSIATTTHPASGSPLASDSEPKKCLAPPNPAKCWQDEDGALNPEFTLPYWQDSAAMIPMAMTRGPGLDALANLLPGDVLQLSGLPFVDGAEVVSAGVLEALIPVQQMAVVAGGRREVLIASGRGRLTVPPREVVIEIPSRETRPFVIRVPTG